MDNGTFTLVKKFRRSSLVSNDERDAAPPASQNQFNLLKETPEETPEEIQQAIKIREQNAAKRRIEEQKLRLARLSHSNIFNVLYLSGQKYTASPKG